MRPACGAPCGRRYRPVWLCVDREAILGGRGYRAPSGLSELWRPAAPAPLKALGPYMDGWGDVVRDDMSRSPEDELDAREGARCSSERNLSMDDLCLGGNIPNSPRPAPPAAPETPAGPSPEDELLSLCSAVSIGASTGFIAGVFRPECEPDEGAGGDSPPVSEAGMGGESGIVEGVATG